jgi:hypothetical protein
MNTISKRKLSKTGFKKMLMCEILHTKPAEFFVYRGNYMTPRSKPGPEDPDDEVLLRIESVSELPDHDPTPVGDWIFVSLAAPERWNDYNIEISQFFKSPSATVDWLAHLHEKHWFDANDFCAMLDRFREATDSYFAL